MTSLSKQVVKQIREARNKLLLLSLEDLKEILGRHDEWFLNWDEFPDERRQVNENDHPSIIDWIMETDPIMVEGGLIDFLKQSTEIYK